MTTNKVNPVANQSELESVNPFSNKGQIRYSTFLITMLMATAFNTLVVLSIRGHLIAARSRQDVTATLLLYGAWFLLFSVGFFFTSNAFIKRWAAVVGAKNLGSFLKFLVRVALLSPVLSYGLSFLTLLYIPGGPFRSVARGGSKPVILIFSIFFMVAAVAVATALPKSHFGLERTQFRESMNGIEAGLPSDSVTTTFLSVASPAVRYLIWLAVDFVRARAVSKAVNENPVRFCSERLGYVGYQVDDCYFRNFRISSEVAPMISPFFGLYFETRYRQATTGERAHESQLSSSLLTVSNLLELIEPGSGFVDRRQLLKPPLLLFGFGSPDVPLVELGQDLQRAMIVKRLLPLLDLQMSAAKLFLKEAHGVFGGDAEIEFENEIRDLQIRIDSIRRDPLAIAHFFLGAGVGVGGALGGSMKAGSPEKE